MSKGHAETTEEDRQKQIEELKQEIRGRLPQGPFEFAEDLTFDSLDPTDDDPRRVALFKLAIKRDCRRASALHHHTAAFGMSQNIRHVFDGGANLIRGGMK